MTARISDWRQRRQISADDAITLGGHLGTEEAVSYVTDFGVQLAVKPFVKVVQWWVIPALWVAGTIGDASFAISVIAIGPIVRSLYTLGRIVQNTASRRERPWVALLVGTIPALGTFAYPVQILASGVKEESDVARFILYDAFARIGQWIPIWGGRDTQTEHLLNRCPDVMLTLSRFPSSIRKEDSAVDTPESRGVSSFPLVARAPAILTVPACQSPGGHPSRASEITINSMDSQCAGRAFEGTPDAT